MWADGIWKCDINQNSLSTSQLKPICMLTDSDSHESDVWFIIPDKLVMTISGLVTI